MKLRSRTVICKKRANGMWSKRFVNNIHKSVIGYQSVLQSPRIPIKEATWEFVLQQAAQKSRMKCEWQPGSHKPGADMTISNKRYSCKTARVTPKSADVLISSYRLTKTVHGARNPQKFIDEIDNVRADFDFYALLVREQLPTCDTINRYSVYEIPTDRLKAAPLEWEKEPNGNWVGVGSDYMMKIHKSMSYQLWLTVPLDYITPHLVANIEIGDTIRPINLTDIYTSLYIHTDIRKMNM